MKTSTVIWIIVGIIVVGLLVYVGTKGSKTLPVETTGESEVTNNPPASSEDVTAGSVHTSASQATLAYNDALTLYKDKMIQFDPKCQAYPNRVNFKNNTDIMIDNRSPKTVTIKLGTSYSVRPYGFKIIHLESSTLPKTILADCGTLQNVATILLQK